MTNTTKVDGETLAIEAARHAADMKCEDVCVLNVTGLSQVTDFVVVGTGTSQRQMRSVGEGIEKLGETLGHEAFRTNTDRASNWIVVDFVNVTIHLLEPNARAFYDIEHLWMDAKRVSWRRP